MQDDATNHDPRSKDSDPSLAATRSFPQLFRSSGSPTSTTSTPLSSDREDHEVTTHKRAKKLAQLLGSNSMSRALLSRTPRYRRKHLNSGAVRHTAPSSPAQHHRRAPIPLVPSSTHFLPRTNNHSGSWSSPPQQPSERISSDSAWSGGGPYFEVTRPRTASYTSSLLSNSGSPTTHNVSKYSEVPSSYELSNEERGRRKVAALLGNDALTALSPKRSARQVRATTVG